MKPQIIRGICEFCGIPANQCIHHGNSTATISPVEMPGLSGNVEEDAKIFIKATPLNVKPNTKRILIGCVDFSQLTGMPMYIYNLGRGLIELGYEVHIVSTIGGIIADKAREAGLVLHGWDDEINESYTALILNEPISERLLDKFPNVPAYNIIHSARPEDEPINYRPQIRKYLASKQSDVAYIKEKIQAIKVFPDKLGILPIPIDFKRFNNNRTQLEKRPYTILAPCTLDELRKPMLKDLVRRAKENPEIRVIIKGKNYGAIKNPGALPANVYLDEEPSWDMFELMTNADEVAGVLQGTVTLEAWAMGLRTSVYDLKGNYKMLTPPKNFQEKHDYLSVARKLDEIINEKWADIIIPHYDQAELLAQTLRSIPLRNYNVIVVRGGVFSWGCNRGAELAQTKTFIFANDDLVINPQVLWEMCDTTEEELVGVPQFYPNGEQLCLGINLNIEKQEYRLTNDLIEATYPSGAFFKISRKLWEDIGGFDERFKNGGEDQDLFLKAIECGARMVYTENSVIHYCSQSTGRFDHLKHNDDLFRELWTVDRLNKTLCHK